MIVIGLTGFAGAGKTTVAEHLVEAHGFQRVSFAAPLKKMLRTLDPIMGNIRGTDMPVMLSHVFGGFNGDEAQVKESRYGPEYRRLLQVLGTDCIRAVDNDFWVRAALKQLTNPKGKYVFDDCRFPNEAYGVRHAAAPGGVLWNIDRPGLERGNHESERYAGRLDEEHQLLNEGTIDGLQIQVDDLVDQL